MSVRLFRIWLPSLLWMAVIFMASTDLGSMEHTSRVIEPMVRWFDPYISRETLGKIHYLIRKFGHLTEYAILGILLYRSLSQTVLSRNFWKIAGWTLLIIFFYASSDEFHQSFVASREPLVTDVFIDTFGASLSLLFLWIYRLPKTEEILSAAPLNSSLCE